MKLPKLILLIRVPILVSVAVSSTVTSTLACAIFPITLPIAGRSIVELQPELQWEAPPEARFRVQISVIAPESRVLMSVDTVVNGNRFKLPSAVPSDFAAVKVLVSQNCPQLDAQDLNAQGPAFFINDRQSCVLEGGISRSGHDTLVWGKSRDATEYVVRLFTTQIDPDNDVRSALLATHRISETQWMLPKLAGAGYPQNGAMVASVQPICKGHPGIAESLFLKPLDLRN
jgi:hypothetical protein